MNKEGKQVKGSFYNIQGVIQTHSHVLWADKLTSDFLGNDK